MKFLIINTDYPAFLQWLYRSNPGLENLSYEEQLRVRNESLFGSADFYSKNLRALGHEAWDIHANNFPLQRAWMNEKGLNLKTSRSLKEALFHRNRKQEPWFYHILSKQIQHFRPDVILNENIHVLEADFLLEMRRHTRLIIAQHAATPLDQISYFGSYDCIISSFPPTVEYVKGKDCAAELSLLAFEPSILPMLSVRQEIYDVTFIGSIFPSVHKSRADTLEFVARLYPQLKIWAPQDAPLPDTLEAHYAGEAWGRQAFEIMRQSKITLNHHGDIPPFANNMRLYEATGTGTLLITDWKENLGELFETGKEVVAYHSPEECTHWIGYYLEHHSERETIARAGQQRTLCDHTYHKRMQEFVGLVQRFL